MRIAVARAAWGLGHLLALSLLVTSGASTALAQEQAIEVYTRPGCPHCAEAREFLEQLEQGRSGLAIIEHDVTGEAGALERLRKLSERAGITTPGVPTFVIGGEVLVGFDPETTPAQPSSGGGGYRPRRLTSVASL